MEFPTARAGVARAAWALLLLGSDACAACSNRSAGGLRLNHAQVLATHNSYHVAPAETILAITPAWNYTHPPLDTQLDRGVRALELDMYYDAAAQQLRVMHIPGSDDVSSCATLPSCLQLVRSWSEGHPGHFPLHLYIQMNGGVAPSEESSSGCLFSDLEPVIPCVETSCVGSPAQDCASAITSHCSLQVLGVVLANSQCSSLAGCLGPAIDAYPPLEDVTSEDVESVLRECTSKVSDQVVPLDGAGQSAALVAIRTALDASFPPALRIKPEDVMMTDDVWWWPEVDASRGKAIFYVEAPGSWGWGGLEGYFHGPGGAISVENDPSSLTGVASGKWVRTRVDDELQIDTVRQAQALAGGAQAMATDFPPSGGVSSWAALEASTGVFWIPGGMPVRCNPVTTPGSVECSARLLEDLSCEEETTEASTTSEAETSQASTMPGGPGDGGDSPQTSTMPGGPGDGGDSPGGGPSSSSSVPEEERSDSTTGAAVQQQVEVHATVTGVDYGLLLANSELLRLFEDACVRAVAEAAGVPTSSVAVQLSGGSVVVRATVAVQGGAEAEVQSGLSSGLGARLVDEVGSVSGIGEVTNGEPITVADVAFPDHEPTLTLSLSIRAAPRPLLAGCALAAGALLRVSGGW